jgi:hypothetical protein
MNDLLRSELSEHMPEWYWYLNARLRSNARKSLLLLVYLIFFHVLMKGFPWNLKNVDAVLDLA